MGLMTWKPERPGQRGAYPFRNMGKVHMKEGNCPYCGREVRPIHFGEGWVGICCGLILYNNRQRPEEDPEADEDMEEKLQD